MVHPSDLLRADSIEGREFAAPADMIDENTIDCGITNLPCLNWLGLERFAKPKVFLTVFSILGFLQGVTLSYFRGTSHIWSKHYHISQDHVDWMIYTNEFFVGIFALMVSYWGNRIHRVSWIGGLTLFHGITCILLLIPEIYRKHSLEGSISEEANLCTSGTVPTTEEVEINFIAIVVLIAFQVFYAMTSVAFFSHGMSYLDDNSSLKLSAAFIGIAYAARELGKQFGIYSTGLPFLLDSNNVFVSPVWICITIITFITGSIIAMFPRTLPSVMMEQVAASIVDLASGMEVTNRRKVVDGFFKSLWRLCRNNILMINISSAVCLQSALINFGIFEKYFNQSRFHVSDRDDYLLVQLTTNLLKQPLVAISAIAAGMVIARTQPKAKSLIKWNILVIVLMTLLFASGAFLTCDADLEIEHEGVLSSPYCSSHCKCTYGGFQPVCVNKKTFFSPCFAGCSSIRELNSNKIYQNCTCGDAWFKKSNYDGSEGSCNSDKCHLFWTLSQANSVLSSALLATTIVTNLVFNMRCVYKRDKALALGLEATFVGIIPYLPVKEIYGAVSENFCKYHSKGVCVLHSEGFGVFLSSCTVGFMGVSVILSIVVLIVLLLKKDSTDCEEDNEDLSVHEMGSLHHEPHTRGESASLMDHHNTDTRSRLSEEELDLRLANGVSNDRMNSRLSTTTAESLADMENVGDDHDSFGSVHAMHSSR